RRTAWASEGHQEAAETAMNAEEISSGLSRRWKVMAGRGLWGDSASLFATLDGRKAQKESRQPAYSLRLILGATAALLHTHIGNGAGGHDVARQDAHGVDLSGKAQHFHVAVHAHLLLAGDDEVAV